jgi:hypothetical protein
LQFFVCSSTQWNFEECWWWVLLSSCLNSFFIDVILFIFQLLLSLMIIQRLDFLMPQKQPTVTLAQQFEKNFYSSFRWSSHNVPMSQCHRNSFV